MVQKYDAQTDQVTGGESSDVAILDLLRKQSEMSVAELAQAMGVTATAVRQRLNRMMGQLLIERSVSRTGRGRPSHRYRLTDLGRRRTGANFADLTVALWREVRAIKDPEVRRGLVQRLAKTMSEMYGKQIDGETAQERMEAICGLFAERNVPFEVEIKEGQLPVLTALACPYPELAEQDRSICSMEKMLFSDLVGTDLKLTQCRLDGDTCCTFEAH